MSWMSPRAVRRHRVSARHARPRLVELEPRVNPTSVLQYHEDPLSNGVNNSETTLTPANVNVSDFGKLWSAQVTGQIYAEPLVETGINITAGANQGLHDVVFVATEHDQLYAIDADAATPTILWQRSFLTPASGDAAGTIYNTSDFLAGATSVTTVPQSAVISSDITVEIGITSTPVIDPNTATLYLTAKTAETVSGTVHYVQRLYAINIQNGTDRSAPFLLGDTTYNGSTYVNYASESSDPNQANDEIYVHGSGGVVQFNALREAQRPGLLLVNGVVYIAWASHGDNQPYHGWMVGVSAYSSSTPNMALTGVLCTTPNGGLGGIWQAGGEITYDDGYFYFETGNGTFDGQNGSGTGSNPAAPAPGTVTGLNNAGFPINGDYADSFVKVAIDPNSTATNQNITTGAANETANSDGWGLKIVDYFTPFNQNYLNSGDLDVGSSAAVIVPDYPAGGFASAAEPQLLIGSGKEGVIYLIDRDGAHQANLGPIAQTINYSSGGIPTSNSGLTLNGSASITGGNLQLTSGSASQTASAWYSTLQNIQQFNTTFTYTLGGTNGSTGEGMAFVVQKTGTSAIGTGGTSLGYGGITPSFAVALSNDSTQGLGTEFLVNGTVVASYTETHINTGLVGTPITVNISYNGSTVTATFTQGSNVDTKTYSVNLVNTLGTYTAYVGFTGATATKTSTQTVSAWSFTASNFSTAYSGSMGGYGLENDIVQNTANQLSGSLDSAALYNNQMYYVQGYGGVAKSFTLANGAFSTTAATQSADQYAFAGSTPFISANNGTNGIVWDVDRGTNQLRAYSATSYGNELWNSAQAPNGRDALGSAVKFEVSTVANGRVYVAAGTGDPNNMLVVYGELAPNTGLPNAPSNLIAQTSSSTSINLSWTDNSVAPNTADSFYIQESTNNGQSWTQIGLAYSTGFAVSGLMPATAYEFQVQAHDSYGVSGFTNVAGATTSASGTHSINYLGGFTTANTTVGGGTNGGGLTFNGATQGTLVPGNGSLQLTTNAGNEARSVYFINPSDSAHAGRQDIVAFSTTFTYDLTSSGSGPADGVTFIIQNTGTTALGAGGGALGYAGITPSFAFAINVYSGNALGTEILTNGVVDENFSETNINTQLVNTPITVTISYAAGFVYITEQQTASGTVFTDTKTLALNIPALIGSDYASVGFTGATGGANSTQQINNWTFDQGIVPAAPAGLAATVTGYTGGANGTVPQPVPLGANLTWTAVTDTPAAGGAVSYKIYRKFTAGGTYALVGTSTTNSFSDTGLSTGSTYYYEVTASDSYSDSLPSAAVSITTPTLPPTPTMGQLVTVTSTSISFQWQNNANNANGYLILRQVGTNGFSILTTLAPDNSNVPGEMSYTDSGLTPGTAYDYHIQSYNLAGYSDFAGVSTTTYATNPTNLVATPGSGSITLNWNGVGGTGATYNIYRGTSAGGEGSTPFATGVTLLDYTDSSLTYGTTYYYKVTAVVSGTETPSSNEVSALASGPTTTSLIASPNPVTPTQTVTLTANVTSNGGTPHSVGSVEFFDNGNLLATVPVNPVGFASYQTTFAAGTHNLTATYEGATGFAASSTAQPVQEISEAAPTIASVTVGDGLNAAHPSGFAERSEVRSIVVTFSGPVTFAGGNAAAAFQLQHVQDSTNINNLAAAVSTNSQGDTVVTLTFSTTGNAATEIDPTSAENGAAASLADGRYQMTIFGSMVTGVTGTNLDGAGTNTPGSNYVSPTDTQGGGAGELGLFRLFGDADGTGVDDQLNLAAFRAAFNSSSGTSAYVSYLDADNSGIIDQIDLGQFRSRFNSGVF